jgi:malate dehydrogenase (oxaloacetate-decarboxylating)
MLTFHIEKDDSGDCHLETNLTGKPLLTVPQLNKGTAFTLEERHTFRLMGKLPPRVETIQEQVNRAYKQFSSYDEPINRNIFLNQILNTNQVLFYKLVSEHLQEMLPIIYTPIVGNAVQQFHKKFLQPRGLYISYHDLEYIDECFKNRSNEFVKLIVMSDGEGVLGIGDQGIGAMMIPIAKLMVYTAIGKINPLHTLPIMLDAGTNNKHLLDSPFYLGWRHERITGKQYDEFLETVITSMKRNFHDVFLHWEDFGKNNAHRNLATYRQQICSFNDDIQGTGVVAVAAILAALRRSKTELKDQRIIIFGAGSAGMGVAYQIVGALTRHGIDKDAAPKQFWLIDHNGLVHELSREIAPHHENFTRTEEELLEWIVSDLEQITLLETIQHVKPTILIGTSAVAGAFSEDIVKEMASHVEHPIIFPLSNPTERAEATPQQLIEWTDGKALIATGSPFDPINYKGKEYIISQCNNFLAFPGLGLGITASKPMLVCDNMLWAASQALSRYTEDCEHTLLPIIEDAIDATYQVAIAVAQCALDEGYSQADTSKTAKELVDAERWEPKYLPYKFREF